LRIDDWWVCAFFLIAFFSKGWHLCPDRIVGAALFSRLAGGRHATSARGCATVGAWLRHFWLAALPLWGAAAPLLAFFVATPAASKSLISMLRSYEKPKAKRPKAKGEPKATKLRANSRRRPKSEAPQSCAATSKKT